MNLIKLSGLGHTFGVRMMLTTPCGVRELINTRGRIVPINRDRQQRTRLVWDRDIFTGVPPLILVPRQQ